MVTGDAIFLGILAILALGLMVMGFAFKSQAVGFGAVFAWLLFAGASFLETAGGEDIFYITMFFGFGMVFVSVFESLAIRRGIEKSESEPEDSFSRFIAKQESYKEKQDRVNKAMGYDPDRKRRA